MEQNGIITGCDEAQEWLLPWWYENVRKHHPTTPICFGDFNMSTKAKNWCKERGRLIEMVQYRNGEKPTPPFLLKPHFMLRSPFETTIWIDLDCEVLAPLAPLFSMKLSPEGLSVRKDPYRMALYEHEKYTFIKHYNSGVVLFKKNSSLLSLWVNATKDLLHISENDDYLLSYVIFQNKINFLQIPYKFNWLKTWGNNPETAILHWIGPRCKVILRLLAASAL